MISDPKARHSDPASSWRAASSVTKKTINQTMKGILARLHISPTTDEKLVDYLCHIKTSPSGIRTRRKELENAGLVISCGEVLNNHNRTCNLWQITKAGVTALDLVLSTDRKVTIGEAINHDGPF